MAFAGGRIVDPLSNIGVLVIPQQMAIPKAFEAFKEDGDLADEKQQAAIRGIGESVANLVKKIA